MPEFSIPALVLSIGLVAYLVAVAPLQGKRQYLELEAKREHDPSALVKMAGRWMAGSWATAALVLLVLAISPRLHPADLGLALPSGLGDGDTAGYLAGIAVGLPIAVAIIFVMIRMLAKAGLQPPAPTAYEALLPRDNRERWAVAGLSITAGVTEELVYRGFLIALGMSLGLPQLAAAAAALVIFVAEHVYQGRRGMALVALAGLALTWTYLSTGSLLLPILMHCVMDLRSLVFVPKPRPVQP